MLCRRLPFESFSLRRSGDTGATGHPGASGAPGASLTIRGLERIDGEGQLWIRTDGGPGGPGGEGGPGQATIAPAWLFRLFQRRCSGRGGPGGRGGDMAIVCISFRAEDQSLCPDAILAPGAAPSALPHMPEARMMIYGAGGRGGSGGAGGRPGDGRIIGEPGEPGAAGENRRLGGSGSSLSGP